MANMDVIVCSILIFFGNVSLFISIYLSILSLYQTHQITSYSKLKKTISECFPNFLLLLNPVVLNESTSCEILFMKQNASTTGACFSHETELLTLATVIETLSDHSTVKLYQVSWRKTFQLQFSLMMNLLPWNYA